MQPLKFISGLALASFILYQFGSEEQRNHFSDQDVVPIKTSSKNISSSKPISSNVPKKDQTLPENTAIANKVASAKVKDKKSSSPSIPNPRKRPPLAQLSETLSEPRWMRDTFYRDRKSNSKLLLTKEDIQRDFPKGLPREINVTRNGKTYRMIHPNRRGTGDGKGKTFYAADEASIDKKVQEMARLQREFSLGDGYAASAGNNSQINNNSRFKANAKNKNKNKNKEKDRSYQQLTSYQASFFPGYVNKETNKKIIHPGDIYDRISQNDFSLKTNIPGGRKRKLDPFKMTKEQKIALQQLSKSLLSLGHGGSVEVSFFGYDNLSTKRNDRITIYENPFKIKKKEMQGKYGEYFLELSYVIVSDDEGRSYQFPCNKNYPLSEGSFCAGTIPSSKGGNKYFLSQIKKKSLKNVQSIKVVDTGNNILPDELSREDAVGADIDAIIIEKEEL